MKLHPSREFVLRDSSHRGNASSSVAKIIVALLALAADEVLSEAFHGSVGGIFADFAGEGECLASQGDDFGLGVLSDLKLGIYFQHGIDLGCFFRCRGSLRRHYF